MCAKIQDVWMDLASERDGKVQECDEIVGFLRFRLAGKFRDLALFYFEPAQPPIVLNAIRNKTSQKFALEFCNIQRR